MSFVLGDYWGSRDWNALSCHHLSSILLHLATLPPPKITNALFENSEDSTMHGTALVHDLELVKIDTCQLGYGWQAKTNS